MALTQVDRKTSTRPAIYKKIRINGDCKFRVYQQAKVAIEANDGITNQNGYLVVESGTTGIGG